MNIITSTHNNDYPLPQNLISCNLLLESNKRKHIYKSPFKLMKGHVMSGKLNWLMSSICAFSALMLSGGVLAWLSVWSDVHTCIWPSWCHYHSLSLASVKSSLVLPFWYRLTQVVPDKGPLNTCVYVCNVICRHCKYFGCQSKQLENNMKTDVLYGKRQYL